MSFTYFESREWFSANPEGRDPSEIEAPVVIMPTDPPSNQACILLNVRVLEDIEFDSSATTSQLRSVLMLWPHLPNTLGFAHCHSLLCYRDYARHLLDHVFGDNVPRNFEEWVKIVATMVSYYPDTARDTRLWSERRHRDQRIIARINTTKNFHELVDACASLEDVWRSMIIR